MISQIPYDLNNIPKEDLERQLLRIGLIAEYDAINLYNQMASMTDDPFLKKAFSAIAKEEKEHVGEFEALLLERDKEQEEELEEGKKEVEELKER
ncbi:rubrerythrin [Patescibacteria group bacterium]|nr:rubrerythrin [Patescibacteria group bacterium]